MNSLQLSINGHMLQAELASTNESRSRGLMYREGLGPDHGMLFMFPDVDYRSFWMKDTAIPLSIAYLSESGVIINIERMMPFSHISVQSTSPAAYALEVNAGWFDKHGITFGDKVAGIPSSEIMTEHMLRKYVRTLFEDGELGRKVFSDRAPMGRHMGSERDTELEGEIWTALWGHLQGLSSKVPTNLLDAMVSFSKDPAYNDVFILHTSGDAYRGMEVSQEYLDEHAPSWREATWSSSKLYWQWSDVIPVDFEYQNRNESRTVSSWTPSRDVAEQFGRAGHGMVGVVLIADSATNTFLDLKELYRFDRLDDFHWEEEIVGFGSIRVKGIKILKKLGGFG